VCGNHVVLDVSCHTSFLIQSHTNTHTTMLCCIFTSRGPTRQPDITQIGHMSQFSVTLFRFGIALPGTILGREGMCGWVGREGDFTFFLTHFVRVTALNLSLLFSHAIIPHYLEHGNQSTNRA
jgi:hypothetical protein